MKKPLKRKRGVETIDSDEDGNLTEKSKNNDEEMSENNSEEEISEKHGQEEISEKRGPENNGSF